MSIKNYFRAFKIDAAKRKNVPPFWEEFLNRGKQSVLFTLPDFGKLLDTDLTALPDTLMIPYERCLLEYDEPDTGENKSFLNVGLAGSVDVYFSKRIVSVMQIKPGVVSIIPCVYDPRYKCWASSAIEIFVSADIELLAGMGELASVETGLKYAIKWFDNTELVKSLAREKYEKAGSVFNDDQFGVATLLTYMGEVAVALSFIEACSCSNVVVGKIGDKVQAEKNKSKPAFKFDSYHCLMLKLDDAKSEGSKAGEGHSGRSPREHLRRGHVRRYADGKKIWIQSMVVNPGVGGKVTKDYVFK